MRYNLFFCFFLALFLNKVCSQNDIVINSDFEKAKTLLTQHVYSPAIKICNAHIDLSIKTIDHYEHSLFLGLKGIAYLDTINADSGKMYLETSFSEANAINYKKSILNSLHGLGKFYYRTANYKTSVKYFQLLNYYSANDSDKNYQLISNYYLSANYNLLKSSALTIAYARKAALNSIELKDTTSYIKSLLSIGTQFFVLKNIDSTEYYCSKASNIYSKYSQKKLGIGADIYNALLKNAILKKDYDKAIYYGKLAIQDCLENNDLPSLNILYDNVAISFTHKKMYDSAIYYYEKALDIETKYNFVDDYKEDLKELFYICKLTHHNDKALYYIEKFISADSLYSQVSTDVIDSLKTAFEIEKNKITLTSENQKINELYEQKQKYYLLLAALSLFFTFLLFYLIYSSYKIRKEKEKQNLLIQIQDTEIKALQAQINPHFIFNSLNSILEYIRRSEKDLAILYLTKFSKLMRMVLEASNKKSILLNDEIELLYLYMELENFRFGNNFKCEIKTETDLDIHNLEIPSMIIQPFLENSILHGLQNKYSIANENKEAFSGKIDLSFKLTETNILCTIVDNGIGRAKAEEIKKNKLFGHKSMGMRITQDRLDLLGQNKCKIDFIDLLDENGLAVGTKVEILIPIIEEF